MIFSFFQGDSDGCLRKDTFASAMRRKAGASTRAVLLALTACLLAGAWIAPASLKAADVITLSSRHTFSPPQGSVKSSRQTSRHAVVVGLDDYRRVKRPPSAGSKVGWRRWPVADMLSCKSAVVMDAETGEILYALRPDTPRQPASTIKVLTGLIAMHSLKDGELVKVSRRAARMPRSKIYLKPGRSYRATDLINAVLLASANDASVALAEKIAGSESAFARLMTRKARAMGARRTVCKTASGLTARGQQTTARDLAVIFRQAMHDPEFASRISLSRVRTREGKVLRTHNRALWRIDGAVGGKTGYTRAARQTYVGLFRRDDASLIVSLMGSESMWEDIEALVEYGFELKSRRRGLQVAATRSRGGKLPGVVSLKKQDEGHLAQLTILTGGKKSSAL